MGGQPAEQIIAGVVLSERLAVTTYGAIHRAQFNGQRDLRGLVIDAKFLENDEFRAAITDARMIESMTRLEHASIVPVFAVESNGPDVVVVTRGVGRYVTAADLITSAKARQKGGGRLAMPVAALIGKSVVEALAYTHARGVVHGAIHPRSVLIGEDGVVRLDNFATGRALATAVAAGADSSLWRGQGGYFAPELVLGEEPTPSTDVSSVGGLLFAMLTGEDPPGTLRATPAIERLVQRALDTDANRRYRSAGELLENLLEALEDDRWQLANRRELIGEAGLLSEEPSIDSATEDLLAALGSAPVPVTKPSTERAGAAASVRAQSSSGGLDSLIADLDHTNVDEAPLRRDPLAESLGKDGKRARVPSLDDPDEDDAPARPARPRRTSDDAAAALDALGELDEPRAKSPTIRAAKVADKPEPRVATPITPIATDDAPPPKLKSPLQGIIGGVILLGVIGAAGYGVLVRMRTDDAQKTAADEARERAQKAADEKTAAAKAALPDPGAISITSEGAGIWIELGKTPLVTTFRLPANQQHDLVLLHAGNEPTEAQVNGTSWSGAKAQLSAVLAVTLKPGKGKEPELLVQPTSQVLGTTGIVGEGYVHVDSTPSGADVWLFLGANQGRIENVIAGRDYELAAVKPGQKPVFAEIKADDWRDNDPSTPIDSAKKKAELERDIAVADKKGK